jgi:hypothetical protein
MKDGARAGFPPKVIWMFWLQGWDSAPHIAKASRASWTNRNPGWRVQALDRTSLANFLPSADVARMLDIDKPVEALSDQLRLELLDRYGGVWADATTICARPLDEWLAEAMPHGFAALSRPAPTRMLSTWFLAAEKGSEIVELWRAATHAYWAGRRERGSYFWVHELFADCHAADRIFREMWDASPVIPADNPFHFGPEAQRLKDAPHAGLEAELANPQVPVFKLTHKFAKPPGPESLHARLCEFGAKPPSSTPAETTPGGSMPVLVAWYGSFAGHGTLGDLRSLEAVVSHLVALGYDVLHATAAPLSIPGARRVNWCEIRPDMVRTVVFVCGPILRNHDQTQAFFRHFTAASVAGVGVSLMPTGHENHVDPFSFVLARQGGNEMNGDVAVVAPLPEAVPTRGSRTPGRLVVGLSLRGAQHEYGSDVCRDKEAEEHFAAVIKRLGRDRTVEIVTLENHLVRAGKPPEAIEAQYRACDLVLTTRFHGAVTALRAGVPFLAIDQIVGGAKVLPLLSPLGWPGLFRIDEADVDTIVRTALLLVDDDLSQELSRARSIARREANRTLRRLGDWLAVQPAAVDLATVSSSSPWPWRPTG